MLKIRNAAIGEGKPKICVPLVSGDFEELEKECTSLEGVPLDMLEWRVDYLMNRDGFSATADLDRAYRIIRSHFPDTPLLTTVRTKGQGGVHDMAEAAYFSTLSLLLSSRWADLLDVEYGHDSMDTKILMAKAREKKIPLLMSFHSFHRALTEEEITNTLEAMASFHPDILKIAVMPETPADVAALLSAAAKRMTRFPETPVMTIAMGPLGVLTRAAGNYMGGPITFAAGKEASAPGQLTANEMRQVLDVLYNG